VFESELHDSKMGKTSFNELMPNNNNYYYYSKVSTKSLKFNKIINNVFRKF
jgi:hypothetical protein